MYQIKINIIKQQGIALIQVLLISTVISILAIHFSFTAREQVAIATAYDQRVKATQALKSAQSKIIYTLLTQNGFEQISDVFPSSEIGNLYGKPFILEQTGNTKILVSIQDNNGLLSQQYIKSQLWTRVLDRMGLDSSYRKQKQGIIEDWQDKDKNSWLLGNAEPQVLENGQRYRNQAIQLPQEIAWFFEKEPVQLNMVNEISTHYSVVGFNPMNAPTQLLELYFNPQIASLIIKKREDRTLTRNEMIDLLGDNFDDVIMSLFQGTRFKIIVQIDFLDVQLQETIEVQLQPNKREPFLIFARY